MMKYKKMLRGFALFMAANMLYEISFPMMAFALTGGPSQPEVQSFEPVGTTEMVDVSTGDFNYNVPLLDVEGYPINIAYHGGIGMDQEASWVGLGWNINPGVINRNMRGLPDDFNGEYVTKEMNMLPNRSYGVITNLSLEVLGKELKPPGAEHSPLSISFSLGISYNNYRGVGFELGVAPAINAGVGAKSVLTGGLGFSASSQDGFNVNKSLGFGFKMHEAENANSVTTHKLGLSVSSSFNSRAGLKSMSYGVSMSKSVNSKPKAKEEFGASAGANGGSTVSFGVMTYVPNISMPMHSTNISFSASAGLGIKTTHPSVGLTGYESTHGLATPISWKKAYGYMYTQNKPNDDVLLDFNRERDGAFSEHSNNLPIPNYTYDLYSVSGQGISAQYRPYRSDIGFLHDDRMASDGEGGKLGGEVGVASDAHFGADIATNTTTSSSGSWTSGNNLVRALNAKDYRNQNKPLYEPFYFKNVGEHTPVDSDFYEIFGYDRPVRPRLSPGFVDDYGNVNTSNGVIADRILVTGIKTYDTTEVELNKLASSNVRQQRDKRNQAIQYMTALEAAFLATDRKIHSYAPADVYGEQDTTQFQRLYNTYLAARQPHHISQITALNPDGMRYVYGIQAYNDIYEEHTFNAGNPTISNADCARGLIGYSNETDSRSNVQGSDNYFSKVTTPPYAHSYLLTSVLSPDYVDVTGNGVTFDDDLGTAIKINYWLLTNAYKWRTPCAGADSSLAYFNEGQKTDVSDNKASYVYGTKELWYVSSIQTKNYVAEFSFSKRQDGLGVRNRKGARDTSQYMVKLDKITLYARKDREINKENAIPIKTVYFEYDYSLCPGVDNNSGIALYKNGIAINPSETDSVNNPDFNVNYSRGKLTLKKIYFSYGKSRKGVLSPYKFFYANPVPTENDPDPLYNPSYNIKAYDRWGNYKPNPDIYSCGTSLSTADYPYVLQNKDSADLYTSAWSLTRIHLPSGGQIKINYESDDYAYVQHKKAMQMFMLEGVGNVNFETIEGVPVATSAETSVNKLYETKDLHYYYLLFRLQPGHRQPSDIKDYFLNQHGQYSDLIYFNILTDLKDKFEHYEYVRGHAELEKDGSGIPIAGVVPLDGDTVGYLKVKDCAIGDKESSNKRVSPFVKTAWQFARLQRPELVHPGSDPNKTGESAIRGLLASMSEVTTLWKSFNKTLQNKNYCKYFVPERSWIRLYTPTFKKLGGGVRVKQIQLSDRWSEMTDDAQVKSSSYGQEYDYTTTENIQGTVRTISSGVAAYEPSIGGEENPWHQPIFTETENLMAPDEKYYSELPYGESFFPAPVVVYSTVTVKNLQYENVKKHATGKVVHEFYTARDFPTLVWQTPIDKKRHELHVPYPREIEDYMTASQGYSIELNDMHGKAKAQWVYAEDDKNPISGVEYKYQTAYKNLDLNRLSNRVRAFDKEKNLISTMEIATEIDFFMDSREHYSSSYNGTSELNHDVIMPANIPITMVWPSFASEKTRFRSMTTVKVINRFGILQKTIAHENGAKIETENILYDAHTGEVLLTRTQNEFKDSVFSFIYPAHFVYEGMGQAYKNDGALFRQATIRKYSFSLQDGLNPKDYFYPGDEVLLLHETSLIYRKGWVHQKTASDSLFFIDSTGYPIGTNAGSGYTPVTIKILRSGRRNLQNIPIAHSVSLKNPVVGDSLKFSASTQILDAGASLFSDQWGRYCMDDTLVTICSIDSQRFVDDMTDIMQWILDSNIFNSPGIRGITDSRFLNSFLRDSLDKKCTGVTGDYHITVDTFSGFNGTTYTHYKRINFFKDGDCPLFGSSSCMMVQAAGFYDNYWTINSPSDLSLTVYGYYPSGYGYVAAVNLSFDALFNSDTTSHTVNLASECIYPPMKCNSYCQSFVGSILNPYVKGLRGNWRKKKDFLYLTERTYGTTSVSARKNGYYTSYNPYWKFDATAKPWKSDSVNWTWSSEVTKYSPHGFEIENRDALNRYSAALYASNNLPVAVGSNTKLRQMAYDGFEDLSYELPGCKLEHWNFKNDLVTGVSIDTNISHTGIRSLKLDSDVTHLATRKIFDCSALTADTSGKEYKLQPCDCIDRFSPDTGYKYVLSGWIKDNVTATATGYTAPSVLVELVSGSGTTTLTFKASGRIIEEWQRIDTAFFIPYGTVAINIKVKSSGSNTTWFDDLRIHPFDGNLKSYVYDPVTMKLMAELDENNFATFYEYDDQGALIRVKKETERGIVTLKESRNSSNKLNP